LLSDVNVSDPCATDPAAGGEDWDGDTKGLDNDGDLDYDQDDADCLSAPVRPSTWSRIKGLYQQ
jgi:hypothetical protein